MGKLSFFCDLWHYGRYNFGVDKMIQYAPGS